MCLGGSSPSFKSVILNIRCYLAFALFSLIELRELSKEVRGPNYIWSFEPDFSTLSWRFGGSSIRPWCQSIPFTMNGHDKTNETNSTRDSTNHGDNVEPAWTDERAVMEECEYLGRVIGNFEGKLRRGELEPEVSRVWRSFKLKMMEELNVAPVQSTNGTVKGEYAAGNQNPPADNPVAQLAGGAPASNQGAYRTTSTPRRGVNAACQGARPGEAGNLTCNNANAPASTSVLTVNDLAYALHRLDTRPVPKPEAFDPESGQLFAHFLIDFENYCRHAFRTDSNDRIRASWCVQLRQFLSGDLLAAYTALRCPGESWDSLRDKLLEWLETSKERMEKEAKRTFSEARRRNDESIRLYAARLQKLYNVAYPARHTNGSRRKLLCDKFLNTIPGRLREQIRNTEATRKSLIKDQIRRGLGTRATLGTGELDWEQMLDMAATFDAGDFSVAGVESSARSPAVEGDDCFWVDFGSREDYEAVMTGETRYDERDGDYDRHGSLGRPKVDRRCGGDYGGRSSSDEGANRPVSIGENRVYTGSGFTSPRGGRLGMRGGRNGRRGRLTTARGDQHGVRAEYADPSGGYGSPRGGQQANGGGYGSPRDRQQTNFGGCGNTRGGQQVIRDGYGGSRGEMSSRETQSRLYGRDERVNDGVCDFCGRLGHKVAECRRYNRLCLLCGGNDHYLRNCQEIRSRRSRYMNGRGWGMEYGQDMEGGPGRGGTSDAHGGVEGKGSDRDLNSQLPE